MRDLRKNKSDRSWESLGTSLFLFAFGVSVLAFLVVIERQEWMSLKPAAGTPATISYAAQAVVAAR